MLVGVEDTLATDLSVDLMPGSNRTNGFRKAISCHYASSSCYYIDVRGTSQAEIAEEVEGIARTKGVEVDYLDVWRYKSRLVAGLEGSL